MLRPKRTEPSAGQESVWDYPRPPRLEKVGARLRVIFNGQTIADTRSGYRVLETSHPPVYYIPPDDIAQAISANRARQFMVRIQGAREILVAQCRRPDGRERRVELSRRHLRHLPTSRAIWRSMLPASMSAGWMTNACNRRKATSTAAGSPPASLGRSRAALERVDGRSQRSLLGGMGACSPRRGAARSLHRLRRVALKRSQAVRAGLPVHQARLSRA